MVTGLARDLAAERRDGHIGKKHQIRNAAVGRDRIDADVRCPRAQHLRLVNAARATLDELLLDYEEFLRQRGKRLWTKDDPEAQAVRAVGSRSDPPDPSDPSDPVAAPARPHDPGKSARWLSRRWQGLL